LGATGNPFVIQEADIRLYFDGDDGRKVWLGGCAERLTLTDEFEETVEKRPGVPFGRRKHTDESHSIEIELVWLLGNELAQEPQMPRIARGQVYKLVIEWKDQETGLSNRRTYLGVTGKAQRIADTNTFTNITYSAEQMFENSEPDAVDYVNGHFREQLYAYDEATDSFSVTSGDVPGYGELRVSSDKIEVFIEGTLCARFDAAGIWCHELHAAAYTRLLHSPRLEFRLANRVFTITKRGEFVVGNITEDDALRDSEDGLVFGQPPQLTVAASIVLAGDTLSGTYARNGSYSNRPFYNRQGAASTSYDKSSIYFNGEQWLLTDKLGNTIFETLDAPDFPELGDWVESAATNHWVTVEAQSGARYAVVNAVGAYCAGVSEFLT
jgi:hypothetical protein